VYQWWVFIHIVGVVGFVLSHGVSTGMALRIRNERSPDAIRALLQVSGSATGVFYLSTLLLLVGGIVAGVDAGWFDQAWIGVALGVFLAEMVFMWAVTAPYYRRIRQIMTIEEAGGSAVGAEEIQAMLRSPVPILSFWVGLVGLLFIVYLMVLKPF
jgi:Predicted integral membrane protein (DUF2269)